MSGKTLAILPMHLLVGDRFTDEEGYWEVTGRPYTTRAGKVVHVTIRWPDEPASVREKAWGAHERITIQRASTPTGSKSMPKTERELGKRAKHS